MRTSILTLCGFVLLLLIGTNLSGASEPEMGQPGPGGNPADIERDVLWLDNPDFDEGYSSSEVIGAYDMWTESANDFILDVDATIRKITWWGAYWNFDDPNQYPTGAGFNLRFYLDVACMPEDAPFVEYLLPGDDCCEALAEGGDQFSQFVYEFCLELPMTAGLYWFSAQMADHEFPPQWGRLGAEMILSCTSVWRSPYFSYPDWIYNDQGIFEPWDPAQMFEDVCEATATENATWGAIKELYR